MEEYRKKEAANAKPGFFSRLFGNEQAAPEKEIPVKNQPVPQIVKEQKVVTEVKKEGEEVLPDIILQQIQKEFGPS